MTRTPHPDAPGPAPDVAPTPQRTASDTALTPSTPTSDRAPASAEDAPSPPHPRHRVDDLLTAPIRLSIVAALSRADEIEFRILRDSIQISDSALSKQLTALEQAAYLTVRKGYLGKRPRTWLSVTAEGRGALRRHLAALTAIVEGEDAAAPAPSGRLEG